ncbi:MAG: polysaccharide deacetylase family protein [Candidatus Omnitrophica bacterium]|nr:polysaccharide deacetylase family protein [Candidatus Omnitrophota bacterium]
MLSTIQVDLDSLWTYDRYRYKQMSEYPVDPVYSQSLQSFLDLFAKYKVKATFFVIGKDAENHKQIKYIKTIIDQGHEIANHSMNHLPDFADLSLTEIKQEIVLAHNLLKALMSKDPVGFRAPMFCINEQVLCLLEDLGYKYDASLMPSAVFPWLMSTAHSLLKLKLLWINCGNIRWGKAPRGIYHPDKQNMANPGAMKIKEVPVSVSNVLRFPMHSTYVFTLGKFLFDSGFNFCLKNKLTLHYVFHAIDLLDLEAYSVRLPGFKSLTKRQLICEQIVKKLAVHSQVMTTEDLILIGKGNNGLHSAAGI